MSDLRRNTAAFVFQGSPKQYDIDGYISRQPFVYWRCRKYIKDVRVGMPAFLKRSGSEGGIVALGTIVEPPKLADSVERPEFLGTDLWKANFEFRTGDHYVGIELDEIRLTKSEGMITWDQLKNFKSLLSHEFITAKTGSDFRFDDSATVELFKAWSSPNDDSESAQGDVEGKRLERRHFIIERSRRLVADKKRKYLSEHGFLQCEICKFRYDLTYPAELSAGFIEVHHVRPLSSLANPRITELNDLLCICANCHRMVHRTTHVEENLKRLQQHFDAQE